MGTMPDAAGRDIMAAAAPDSASAPRKLSVLQELSCMKIKTLAIAAILAAVSGFAGSEPAAPAKPGSETAVFAGGCYWGTEAVFEHVKGVTSVVSGYAGGSANDANYRAVSAETTRHAESVKITFDPNQITYDDLLLIFFATHDPTEVNRQGPDVGPSYRSAIFPQNAGQAKEARDFIDRVDAAHLYKKPIATRIETGDFFPGEHEMQHYFDQNQSDPYIIENDVPKVKLLQQKFQNFYKA